MFSLMLLAIVAVSCSATCLSSGDANVTGNKAFNIPLTTGASCNSGSWINVTFSCGKTLTFRQKAPTSTSSPLAFNCSHFYSSSNDPNLICDFYQCQSYAGKSVVTASYDQSTQTSSPKSRLLAQAESQTLTLKITGELTPPDEVDTKDKNLLTIIIIAVVVVIAVIIVFVVFCVLCKKKRTQTSVDAAQKVDAAYREHPKNEMIIDIVKRQKRYDDSENTDEFYMNTGDSGALAVASDKIKTTRSSRHGPSARSKSNKSRTIESEDGSFMITDGKLHSSSRASFHDESFTINRVLKPATGNLDLTDSDN
ncbi:Hypothetical protein GSB_152886 [Giardia duodenalis]|uniref:Uncharacterized protein n=2 Tax=Giardia intestinalis TaxID=5741 RepID=C6LWE4_GIAIB|nr:Hypothetical protein GL50581_3102 [Giardia intestinalis ATCC 50581]ESU42233.1 Hypothetical protein GSB_152886 [Giardia intestinalis]